MSDLVPFTAKLGLQVEPFDGAPPRVHLPADPSLGNRRGEVHGGAIATLLDVALARTARFVAPADATVATITITINYLSPGVGALVAEGRVLRPGRTIIAVEARVTDAVGELVAVALASFRVIARRPG